MRKAIMEMLRVCSSMLMIWHQKGQISFLTCRIMLGHAVIIGKQLHTLRRRMISIQVPSLWDSDTLPVCWLPHHQACLRWLTCIFCSRNLRVTQSDDRNGSYRSCRIIVVPEN
jgi:hypothetical protein